VERVFFRMMSAANAAPCVMRAESARCDRSASTHAHEATQKPACAPVGSGRNPLHFSPLLSPLPAGRRGRHRGRRAPRRRRGESASARPSERRRRSAGVSARSARSVTAVAAGADLARAQPARRSASGFLGSRGARRNGGRRQLAQAASVQEEQHCSSRKRLRLREATLRFGSEKQPGALERRPA